VSSLRAFFTWARKTGLRDDRPTDELDHRPKPTPVREALTREQLDAYLARVRTMGVPRDVALIHLAAETALLAHELEALDLADVRAAAVVVRGGSGTPHREVPLSVESARYLAAWIEKRGRTRGPLFVSFRGARLERHSMGLIFKRYEVGVPVGTRILRSTFARIALEEGGRAPRPEGKARPLGLIGHAAQ
jgi:integrase/recombinase XerD